MCARYSLGKDGLVITIGKIEVVITFGARYNVAPTQSVPIIVPDTKRGYKPIQARWGWKRADGSLLVNGQSETIQSKPTFTRYIENRCLIPADGFYEWTNDKTPIRFTKENDEPFCFAGLFLTKTTQSFDVLITEHHFIILTMKPNETVKRFHNRMPLIINPKHYDWWLGHGEMFQTAMNFPDDEELEFCPVQRDLNNVKNEGRELIRPSVIQKELF